MPMNLYLIFPFIANLIFALLWNLGLCSMSFYISFITLCCITIRIVITWKLNDKRSSVRIYRFASCIHNFQSPRASFVSQAPEQVIVKMAYAYLWYNFKCVLCLANSLPTTLWQIHELTRLIFLRVWMPLVQFHMTSAQRRYLHGAYSFARQNYPRMYHADLIWIHFYLSYNFLFLIHTERSCFNTLLALVAASLTHGVYWWHPQQTFLLWYACLTPQSHDNCHMNT